MKKFQLNEVAQGGIVALVRRRLQKDILETVRLSMHLYELMAASCWGNYILRQETLT